MLRIVAWKVADRALVMADWNGFCEACLPGDGPAWHPSGDFLAFAVGETRQFFPAGGRDSAEMNLCGEK